MVNEQVVVDHIGYALAIAMTMRAYRNNFDEARSIALMTLVECGREFIPRPGVEDGQLFWGYARMRIRGALVDALRRSSGRRSRRQYVPLKALHGRYEIEAELNARLTIARARRRLTKGQDKVIAIALEGWDVAGGAAAAGLTEHSYRTQKHYAVARMRAALSLRTVSL